MNGIEFMAQPLNISRLDNYGANASSLATRMSNQATAMALAMTKMTPEQLAASMGTLKPPQSGKQDF